MPSNIKEHLPQKTRSPKRLAKNLALKKALDVAGKLKSGLVIGADTIVVCKNEIIGKPKNYEDAKRILRKLSSSRHYVITGVALVNAKTKKKITFAEQTKVKMKKMTPGQISYFAKKHLDKAGAYALQEQGDEFIESIEGSFSNVVGLPVEKLKWFLNRLNNVPTKTGEDISYIL
ncbi:MAG: Maf family protein [Candidatus Omnitrophota bacterium]